MTVGQEIEERVRAAFCLADMELSGMGELFALSAKRAEGADGAPLAARPSAGGGAIGPVDPVLLLQKDLKLPSLPQAVVELQTLINDPNSSASDLARVISQDVNLSAFLLRMVNSAFYNFSTKIETISRAVAVLGVRQLSTLAFGSSVLDMFRDVSAETLDLERYWKHSIACGLLARSIATIKKFEEPERFFVAGLLHDIGRMALFKAAPKAGQETAARAVQDNSLHHLKEAELLGFDHAKLGGMLLRKWNFPFFIVMAVLDHHTPQKAKEPLGPGVVQAADSITHALGLGGLPGWLVPPPDPESWNQIGLTDQEITQVINDRDQPLEETFSILTS